MEEYSITIKSRISERLKNKTDLVADSLREANYKFRFSTNRAAPVSKEFFEGIDMVEIIVSGAIGVVLENILNGIINFIKNKRKDKVDDFRIARREDEIEIIDVSDGTKIVIQKHEIDKTEEE